MSTFNKLALVLLLALSAFPVLAETGDDPPQAMAGSDDDSLQALLLQRDDVGSYLADPDGMTLYAFAHDSPGTSVCTGACLETWPHVPAYRIVPARDMNPADFGSLTRDDGTVQATFRGYPLYTYAKDLRVGDVNGQGAGGAWHVIDPANFPAAR